MAAKPADEGIAPCCTTFYLTVKIKVPGLKETTMGLKIRIAPSTCPNNTRANKDDLHRCKSRHKSDTLSSNPSSQSTHAVVAAKFSILRASVANARHREKIAVNPAVIQSRVVILET